MDGQIDRHISHLVQLRQILVAVKNSWQIPLLRVTSNKWKQVGEQIYTHNYTR